MALSPVFLAVSIAVYIDDPGPILFKQKRVVRGTDTSGLIELCERYKVPVCGAVIV